MIIEIESCKQIKRGMCKALGLCEFELMREIYLASEEESRKEYGFEEAIVDYICNKRSGNAQELDEVYLCHLTCSIEPPEKLLPLKDLLQTENPFSNFLKDHDISFDKESDAGIRGMVGEEPLTSEVLLKMAESAEPGNKGYYMRLLQRLNKDHCVNGFTFAFRLEENSYLDYLRKGPEFLQDLDRIFGLNLCREYLKISKYYKAIIRVPMSDIIFDEGNSDDMLTKKEKEIKYLVTCAKLLHDDYFPDRAKYSANRIIRLPDTMVASVEKAIIVQDTYA